MQSSALAAPPSPFNVLLFLFFMKRTWLLFAPAVTVMLAAYFVLALL